MGLFAYKKIGFFIFTGIYLSIFEGKTKEEK